MASTQGGKGNEHRRGPIGSQTDSSSMADINSVEAREVKSGLESREGHSAAVPNDYNQVSLPVLGQGGSSHPNQPAASICWISEATGRILKEDKEAQRKNRVCPRSLSRRQQDWDSERDFLATGVCVPESHVSIVFITELNIYITGMLLASRENLA